MRILHLDIETCPNIAYVWGVYQQFIPVKNLAEPGYTLCWSAKWHKKRELEYSSLQNEDKGTMLERIWYLLDGADAVVHYNGTKFDIPTLNKEFLEQGWAPPSPYKQIDLFKVVKKNFRFPSYKLEYVAQSLGVGAKVQHMGMALWTGCMEGDPACWEKMEKYNKRDTRLLEKMYKRLLPWISNHPNYALYVDTTRPTCPNCGGGRLQSRGFQPTTTQLYRRYRCMSCGTWTRERTSTIPASKRSNILTQA